MYAVEFNTTVNNGKIEIPLQYRGEFNSDVKVILFRAERQHNTRDTNKEKMENVFGALAHLANPDLQEQEEGAWERMVAENYAVD